MDMVKLWVAVGLMVTAAASAAADVAKSEGDGRPASIHENIVYHNAPQRPLHVNIYSSQLSSQEPSPVIVHFHGGGWMRGARPKNWYAFGPYLEAGLSVVTVEYRLGREALAPAAVQDARCAVKWVADSADRYGFDRNRIVLMGTSSGAHLALMAGLMGAENSIDVPACRGGAKVAAILDFYAPVDIAVRHPVTGKRPKSFERWTGGGKAGLELARRLSPINWVSADSPPIYIVHGADDPVIPVAQSRRLRDKLEADSIPYQLRLVEGGKHGGFTKADRLVIAREILSFLREVGVHQ